MPRYINGVTVNLLELLQAPLFSLHSREHGFGGETNRTRRNGMPWRRRSNMTTFTTQRTKETSVWTLDSFTKIYRIRATWIWRNEKMPRDSVPPHRQGVRPGIGAAGALLVDTMKSMASNCCWRVFRRYRRSLRRRSLSISWLLISSRKWRRRCDITAFK